MLVMYRPIVNIFSWFGLLQDKFTQHLLLEYVEKDDRVKSTQVIMILFCFLCGILVSGLALSHWDDWAFLAENGSEQ